MADTPKRRKPAHAPKAQEVGFWHEFEDSLEHLRRRRAIVVISLDRVSGEVEVDEAMSTPMETWAMLTTAEAQAGNRLDLIHGLLPDD